RKSRDEIQTTRAVSDTMLWRLFGLVDAPVYQHDDYLRGYENLVAAFDVTEPAQATRVLVITGDPIGKKLAGPAIRAWNMAEQLSVANEVVLVTLTGAEELDAPFQIVHVRAG